MTDDSMTRGTIPWRRVKLLFATSAAAELAVGNAAAVAPGAVMGFLFPVGLTMHTGRATAIDRHHARYKG